MPKTVNLYRVYCVTDQRYEFAWGKQAPIVCPVNTSHTIDPTLTTIVDKVHKKKVKVQEETIETGGHFGCLTITIDANPNSTTTKDISLPMPITALAVEFVSQVEHENDKVDLCVNPDVKIGTLTADLDSTSSPWTEQNYTEGSVVTVSNLFYTCITDTVANEPVTNETYWRRGVRLSVSPTVTDLTKLGYYIAVENSGLGTEPIGRAIGIDKTNSYIYVENTPSQLFPAAGPTYVTLSVYPIKDFIISGPWEYNIGMSKIGGSHISADTPIRISYHNKDPSESKTFVGRLEYLY